MRILNVQNNNSTPALSFGNKTKTRALVMRCAKSTPKSRKLKTSESTIKAKSFTKTDAYLAVEMARLLDEKENAAEMAKECKDLRLRKFFELKAKLLNNLDDELMRLTKA